MFKIFLKNNLYIKDKFPIKKYSRFDWIKRRYLFEIDKITNYYRYERERAVNNNHILSRLIQNIAPDVQLDDFDYFIRVSTESRYISKQYQITSNINPGEIHKNIFYNSNSFESLLYIEEQFDIEEMKKDWISVPSVRCVYHENTDLDFYIPFGKKDLRRPKLSVYELDIVKMMMQYKWWAQERMKYGWSTNTNVFVAMVAITNMMPNILELSLFNRFLTIANDGYVTDFYFDHPFNVLDYSTGIDNILLKIKKEMKHKRYSVLQILQTIPSFNSVNMYDNLIIHHNIYTRQSSWVLWIARLAYISDLINILGKPGISANKDTLNQLPILIKELENRDTDLSNKINNTEIELDIDYAIENIKEKIGRR